MCPRRIILVRQCELEANVIPVVYCEVLDYLIHMTGTWVGGAE